MANVRWGKRSRDWVKATYFKLGVSWIFNNFNDILLLFFILNPCIFIALQSTFFHLSLFYMRRKWLESHSPQDEVHEIPNLRCLTQTYSLSVKCRKVSFGFKTDHSIHRIYRQGVNLLIWMLEKKYYDTNFNELGRWLFSWQFSCEIRLKLQKYAEWVGRPFRDLYTIGTQDTVARTLGGLSAPVQAPKKV